MSRFNSFLRDIKVVDVSFYIPGPMASLQLADMGADVTKVEPPWGDDMRALGPRDADGKPLFYEALNAGKTVMRLDLKAAEGRQALLDLTDFADIFIEGFRPGVMDRLGLGAATLLERNPRLITCSISGHGAEGPLAQSAGHDGNYLAAAGVLHRNGMPPRFFDPPIADLAGSLFAVIAILGALQSRARDGLGCHIDLGLADVAMPLQLFEIAAFGASGDVPQANATYLNGGAAYYQIYAIGDGRHVMVGAVEPKFWQAFSQAAGHPEWIARQSEALPQHRLIGDVAACLETMSLADCVARFASGDCCVTPVLDLAEAVASPHHAARGLVTRTASGLQSLFPAWIDGAPPKARETLKERI